MRRIAILVAALLTGIAARPLPSRAATPYTEDFAGGSNGWRTVNESGASGSWSITNGVAYRTFSGAGGGPPTGNTLLVASNSAASGAFSGDYVSAGTLFAGFDFRFYGHPKVVTNDETMAVVTNSGQPSYLGMEVQSTTNVFRRDIYSSSSTNTYFSEAGTWYTIRISLRSPGDGGWYNADINSPTAIPDSLWQESITNIRAFAVRLKEAGLNPIQNFLQYEVDNIFLDELPRAAAVDVVTTGVVVRWEGLRSNTVYRMEASTNVTLPTWSSVDLFTATSGVHFVSDPTATNGEPRTYRVRTE